MQILAGEHFPATEKKTTTNRGAERTSLSKAKATPSTGHRGEAATKNKQTNNYPAANETDEES